MNILEIPVIGNRNNEKEKIFSLLSDQPIRNFEGLDFGFLKLNSDLAIYLYFLNQESENYKYLWDIIIPHSIGCVLVFDWRSSQLIEENLKTIEYIEKRFSTPMHICSLPTDDEMPDDLIREELEQGSRRHLYTFNPNNKESVKDILLKVVTMTHSE